MALFCQGQFHSLVTFWPVLRIAGIFTAKETEISLSPRVTRGSTIFSEQASLREGKSFVIWLVMPHRKTSLNMRWSHTKTHTFTHGYVQIYTVYMSMGFRGKGEAFIWRRQRDFTTEFDVKNEHRKIKIIQLEKIISTLINLFAFSENYYPCR